MKFFVTGASSFVGVEVCRYLTEKGHEVIAMSRRENESLNAIALTGNLMVFLADMQTLVEKAKNLKADVFIHLAWAGTSHEERNFPAIHDENLRLSLDYVHLAKRMGCQLYVDAGSQAEYGIVPGIITEKTECHPFSAYGKSKLKMYFDSKELTEKLEMKYIHLRILSVYGENDHPHTLIMTSINKMRANEPIIMHSGGQKWNYVYVKDAARQIGELSFHAIEDNAFKTEIYNIASEDTRKLEDFIKAMKVIIGSSSELIFGGYNPETDVNLEPDMTKTAAIIKPLEVYRFEDIIPIITRQ